MIRSSTTAFIAAGLVTASVAIAQPPESSWEEPKPPGWEVPAWEEGASPHAPDVVPPPIDAVEPERDYPDLELDPEDESTREDGDSGA